MAAVTTQSSLDGATIVFDLDGTLVDTAPDLIASLNHVLSVSGRSPLPGETVRMIVGHGAKALIERGFIETGDPVDPELVPGHVKKFVDYYQRHIADDSAVFPGVRDTLERLRAAGATLAVCTNKHETLAHQLLKALDLDGYFAAVAGADTFPVKKPHADAFHMTVKQARTGAAGPPGFAVMVGDSPTDAETARAAGVPFIAVSFGYTPVSPDQLGADVLIDHFDALDDALKRVLALSRTPDQG